MGGFATCHSLVRVSLPASVEHIAMTAFYKCSALREVFLENDSGLEHLCQARSSNFCRIGLSHVPRRWPKNVDLMEQPRELLCRQTTRAWSFFTRSSGDFYLLDEPLGHFTEIPECVKNRALEGRVSTISDRLLCLCASQSILIPPFVCSIGSCFHSIDNCVESLDIPASIEEIDGFLEVHGLLSVQFSNDSHLRSICGFLACESLQRVELPPSVEIVRGFFRCHSLTEVVFNRESQVHTIHAFCRCTSLSQIEIPASVQLLSGFDDCDKIASVGFSVNSLLREIHGFSRCASISEIQFPDSVEIVEGFNECQRLETVIFLEDSHVRTLHGFSFCRSLLPIQIPASISEICGFAFSKLHQLTLAPGTQLRSFTGVHTLQRPNSPKVGGMFIVYNEEDLKQRRRRFNGMSADCSVSFPVPPQMVDFKMHALAY
jgi:hypothetical protein